MKKATEILKMLWGPRRPVNKPDPTPGYRFRVEFSKEQAAINIQTLCSSFENKQAIYIEKGALLVRVTNISASMVDVKITAQAEEVITPGIGVGLFALKSQKGRKPLFWNFGAGDLTCFSDAYWAAGYGGWSLYFDPKVIEEVLQLAISFPPELNAFERYSRIVRFIHYDRLPRPTNVRRVFPPISEHTARKLSAPLAFTRMNESSLRSRGANIVARE